MQKGYWDRVIGSSNYLARMPVSVGLCVGGVDIFNQIDNIYGWLEWC